MADELTNRPPNFWIRLDKMRAQTNEPRTDAQHDWLPPRRRGANVMEAEFYMPVGTAFYFQGQPDPSESDSSDTSDESTTKSDDFTPGVQQDIRRLPDHLRDEEYQCYSLYVGEDKKIWTLPFDATKGQIYDGNDTGAHDESDIERQHDPTDWRQLQFRRVETKSYATHTGERARLFGSYRDQLWIQRIIPERYHPRHTTGSRSRLVGDVALLVGLFAISLPDTGRFIGPAIPQCIKSSWSCFDNARMQGPVYRELPMTNCNLAHCFAGTPRRGMVVTVWLNLPPRTDEVFYAEQSKQVVQMKRYEAGQLGGLFS